MNKFRAPFVLAIITVAIIILFVYRNNKNQQQIPAAQKPFVIGSFLPLTGDVGALGQDINRGAQIALDEARQQGVAIDYISEDDRLVAVGSTNAANKLLDVNKVDAAFTAIVSEAKPVVPLFNGHSTPLLVTWDSNDYLKHAGSQIFSIGFSTEAAGEDMADYAYNTLNLRRVAIIYHTEDWSELISQTFAQKFTALGGTIVLNEKTQLDTKDYRTVISKTKAVQADGIYFPLDPPSKGPFMAQAKQLGFTGQLMTGDSLLQDEIHNAGSAAENVYYTNLYSEDSTKLVEKYKQKYHSDPVADPVFVSFGYDGMRTLITALQLSRSQNISVRDALTRTNLSATGFQINMNGGQFSERKEKLYKLTNGQSIEVKQGSN